MLLNGRVSTISWNPEKCHRGDDGEQIALLKPDAKEIFKCLRGWHSHHLFGKNCSLLHLEASSFLALETQSK